MKNILNNIYISLILGICIFMITSVLAVTKFLNVPIIYLILISLIFAIGMVIITFIIMTLLVGTKTNYKKNIPLENVPLEFEKIYEELYNNHISLLEKMRKRVRWRIVLQNIAFVFSLIGYVFTRSDHTIISRKVDLNIIIVGFICFFIAIFFLYKNIKYKNQYIGIYKKEIVAKFIELLNNHLVYNPTDISLIEIQSNYKMAGFDNKEFNRFYVDDFIKGFLGDNIFLNMCDLHIQNHTGSGRNSHTEEIFQGLFCKTRCDKNINTVIKILKNRIKILKQENRTEMDSQEFEKYFDVYSENRLIAMQLLTSDIMELLVDFYRKYELEYELVFENNNIYMRFFTGPMFEPKIFGNSMDKKLLYMYFSILKFVLEVTKIVNKTLEQSEI